MSHDNQDSYDSETSDEDYIPKGEASEVSCDSSGEDIEADKASGDNVKQKKKVTKSTADTKRKRKGGIKLEGESDEDAEEETIETDSIDIKTLDAKIKEEEEKKRTDSLWADFMGDVGGPSSQKKTTSSAVASSSQKPKTESKPPEKTTKTEDTKISITKIFEFAGEEVRITKEVSSQSKEAKSMNEPKKEPKPTKRAGIGGFLDKINKKPKISVLDKSKLDWQTFKQDEGIENELDQYKKGKDGYLAKQDFLERTDYRQFEIEKDLRQSKR